MAQNNKLESKYWKDYNEKKALKLLCLMREIMGDYMFCGETRNPFARILFLLEHLDDKTMMNTFSFYLSEYGVDEKGFVLELLKILCKHPYNIHTNHLIEIYNELSIIENVSVVSNGFEIKTESGKIRVYRALEELRWKREYVRAYQKIRKEDSNLRMILLNTRFSEDMVMSCLMPRMFGGNSYEYYIKLIRENGFLDIKHGCFYPSDMFESYFEPKILSKRKGKNLKMDLLNS